MIKQTVYLSKFARDKLTNIVNKYKIETNKEMGIAKAVEIILDNALIGLSDKELVSLLKAEMISRRR